MKPTIENLRDSFKISFETFEESRREANQILDMYHNRQYTPEQEAILENRGQPKETFNIIRLFTRMMVGYYSTVINNIQVKPVQFNDIDTASLLNDTIQYVLRDNNFTNEADKIKLDGLLTGLMCSHIEVEKTEEKDRFGRPVNRIRIAHVPANEIVIDPMSYLEDYSDARFIHRFKWVDEETAIQLFGKAKVKDLEEYYNFLDTEEADFEYKYGQQFQGKYKYHNNYLIVHSIIKDDDISWSVFWSNETILAKKKVAHNEVAFPYRVQKMSLSNKAEYYGPFREVVASQQAINQAIIKIQLMVNTQKVFVQDGSVDDLEEFTDTFNRVNAIIPVKALAGIKVENLTREVLDQYTIIDKAFDRIQRLLGINDSFLGMAFASDSGRKVKLQQNAAIIALQYITAKYEQYYKMLGWDIANLVKQYYTAEQVLRVADEVVGERWIHLNKPMEIPTADLQGTFVPYREELDANGEPVTDEEGNIVVAPYNEPSTELAFTNIDIEISSNAYNDEDEKNQLMMETVLSGGIGQLLSQVNPAGFFKAAGLSIRTMKTKYSSDISQILEQTAMMLGADQQAAQEASLMAQGNGGGGQGSPQSNSLKLPQNTNEGV